MPILPETYSKLTQTEKSSKTYLKPIIIPDPPTAHINDCSKVILHDLIRQLKSFVWVYIDFLDQLDEWMTDLLFHTNRPKHLTFKYEH